MRQHERLRRPGNLPREVRQRLLPPGQHRVHQGRRLLLGSVQQRLLHGHPDLRQLRGCPMRSSIRVALLLSLAATSCRSRPAVEPPRSSAVTERPAPPAARADGCGVVARLDLQALARVSPSKTLDELWRRVLPGDAAPATRDAVVHSTRAAELCSDFGPTHRRDFGIVLEGDYPPDLLDRLLQNRAGLSRAADGRSFVGPKVTVSQPEDRRLIVSPAGIRETWIPNVSTRLGTRPSLLAISIQGDALHDVLNGQAGFHPRELDGVTAIDANVARDGSALTIRLRGPDATAIPKLAAALSDFVAGLRERAARAKHPLPEIGVRAEADSVAVAISLSAVDRDNLFAQLSRLIAGRRRS